MLLKNFFKFNAPSSFVSSINLGHIRAANKNPGVTDWSAFNLLSVFTRAACWNLRPKELTGNIAEDALERAGITCNKNGIPFDPEKPSVTSGIRLGTPAGTSRGFGEKEFILIANLISDVLDGLRKEKSFSDSVEKEVKNKIKKLCYEFPIY